MQEDRGLDGRQLPWVACDLPLEPGPGRVIGLAMDALRLAGASDLESDATAQLAFRLPGQSRTTVIQGRAERLEPAAAGPAAEPVTVVTIERFEGGTGRAFQQHVLARIGAQALERQAEALLRPAGRLVPLTGTERVKALLADSLATRADAVVHGAELAAPLRATVSGVSASEVVLTLDDPRDAVPLAGTRIRCALLSRHGPYLFETSIRARMDRQLRVALPDRLHQYEKRAEPRTVVAADPGCVPGQVAHTRARAASSNRVVIPLPAFYGGPIERPLIDVSEGGAAFRSRPGDPLFLPGTPLPGVVLVRDGRHGAPRPAEVRQVSPELPRTGSAGAEGQTYRVGLALDVERTRSAGLPSPGPAASVPAAGWVGKLAVVGRWSLMAARSRLPRLGGRPQAAGALVNVMRYRGRNEETIVALVNATQALGGSGARLRGPLVVIPPAFGKTKETYCALALALVETFRRNGRDVLVVRYDGVRTVGESHKDPEDWVEGRQMMRYTLSQGAADLAATLDYFHGRPWFWPTHTVIISFSLAALPARRAVLDDPFGRITHWLSVMGAVDAQDVFFNATGGIDLIGGHQLGIRFGVTPVLGHLGDVDRFAADAIACGLATLRDARRDLARIRIPVTWFVGRDDRWVRPERVRDVMSVAAPAPRQVVELPIGHTLPMRVEALASVETSIAYLWSMLYGEALRGVSFDEATYRRVAAMERERLPRRRIVDARGYWKRYLLGDDGRGVGFDLWANTPAYRELMDLQRQLLDVSEGDVVADLGAGTGNFVEHLLERLVRDGFRTSPKRLVVADLVGAALARAREKAAGLLEGVLLPGDFLEFREMNLEMSRLRPIRRFVEREMPSLDRLRGLVDGLPDRTLDAWLALYDDRLVAFLRGSPDAASAAEIERLLDRGDLEIAIEFNRAARWVLGRLAPGDFRLDLDPAAAKALLAAPGNIRAEHLRFERLRFAGVGPEDALPFPDTSLDKALLSLVLSYLFNPGETLREVHRAVRPGGRVVASSVRPDADMSRLVEELVDRVAGDPEIARRFGLSPRELTAALQKYLNQAASIYDLEEGGVFRFFSRDELARLLEEAGFDQVKVYESFGQPPLIFVAVGVRR